MVPAARRRGRPSATSAGPPCEVCYRRGVTPLQVAVSRLVAAHTAIAFSCLVLDVESSRVLAAHEQRTTMSTASVGKILLLIEVATRLDVDPAWGSVLLDRASVDPVRDSGLWEHLRVDRLPVADVAALVAAVSDNLATNVLIREVGLDRIAATADRLGLVHTTLHDIARGRRGPQDPPRLSSGDADELAHLLRELWLEQEQVASSAQVIDWLRLDVDHSLVAAAFCADPLVREGPGSAVEIANKTGSNVGVRADVGVVRVGSQAVAYAVIANWVPAGRTDPLEMDAIRALRAVGEAMRDHLLTGPHR
jgi:beta-lactamase class A